jgi:hypothetical protein
VLLLAAWLALLVMCEETLNRRLRGVDQRAPPPPLAREAHGKAARGRWQWHACAVREAPVHDKWWRILRSTAPPSVCVCMARAWLSCHARKMERENGMNRGGGGGVEMFLKVKVAKI